MKTASRAAPKAQSGDRLDAFFAGERIDRVPVLAFALGYAAYVTGVNYRQYFADPVTAFAAQLGAQARHGYDDRPAYVWADYGGWEFGGQLEFPTRYSQLAPRTTIAPVRSLDDAGAITVPDPRTAGSFPRVRQFGRLCRDHGFKAGFRGGTPSLLVSSMLGAKRYLTWTQSAPRMLATLYEKATTFIIRSADSMVDDFGAQNVSVNIGAPLDGHDLVSPSFFANFVLPQQRRINAHLIRLGVTDWFVHLCGDHLKNLPYWASLPWTDRTIFSFSHCIDLRVAAKALGNTVAVAGNIPTRIFSAGTPGDVARECDRCLARYADLPGGYILMPECDMPVTASPSHVDAMIASARRFGGYQRPARKTP